MQLHTNTKIKSKTTLCNTNKLTDFKVKSSDAFTFLLLEFS